MILADVMMSGLDGFQLIQRVRAEPLLMHTPVILLTARAGEEAAILGLEAGAGDYIAKPFSPRELLARIQVVHARAQAQAVLRERAARQAFLVKLGDGLRPLADPVQIQATAAQITMDYYGAERCYYCEIEAGRAIIRRDAAREGLPSVVGVYPLAELPLFVAAAEAGTPLVVADAATSAVLDEELKQLCIQLQIIAYINVPVMKGGRYAGNLCITQSTPRTWTALEVELAVETAERTWDAVVPAQAEAARREGEEKYRMLFNSIEEGFCLIDMIFDAAGAAVDYRFLEANRAFEQRTGLANVVGRMGSEVTPGTEPYWISGYGAVARTGEPWRVENYHAPTGRWYRGYATRVGGEGSRQVAIVFDDITAHKRNAGRGEA